MLEIETARVTRNEKLTEYSFWFSIRGFNYYLKAKKKDNTFYPIKLSHNNGRVGTSKICPFCGYGYDLPCEPLKERSDEVIDFIMKNPRTRLRAIF